MRVLFMGTPDFALESFRALCDNFEVVGAVTQPDKPRGRGYELTPSPIKLAALERGVKVYQPTTLKDGAFADELAEIAPDLVAVVAYGKILPEYVLNYPRLGCINLHGSLLPKYRGAAPMQRAIIDGERVTGVTTMYMAKGLDTGDMLETAELEIGENDNFEVIHDALSSLGAGLLVSTIKKLDSGEITPIKQDDTLATYAAKIEKTDCEINFANSAEKIHNLIRGLSPIPLAFTHNRGKLLKVISSTICDNDGVFGAPGEVLSIDGGRIRVACGQGSIFIDRVTPEGKRAMSVADYINGRQIAVGDILGVDR